MAPKRTEAAPKQPDEVRECPLCITELDATERAWAPCACGYQLCLFCYDRIKTEYNKQCPGCRTPYDADFQISLVRRKEEAAAANHASSPTSPSSVGDLGSPPAAAAVAVRRVPPPSPGRDLHIDQEQLWPSLSAASLPPPTTKAPAAAAGSGRQPSPREVPAPPPVATSSGAAWAGAATACGKQHAHDLDAELRHSDHLLHENCSSSSSATTATTPQSPASSVVAYRARTASSMVEQLQGTCHVSLGPSVLAAPPLDEEGAGLAASLQDAVKAGSISVKQAAASLVSYLRQKQLAALCSSVLGSRGPPSQAALLAAQGAAAAGGSRLSAAGHAVDVGRGSGLFLGASPHFEGNPSCEQQLESSPSLAVSEAPTFSQWARSDSLPSPGVSLHGGAGLFEGWGSSLPQQQPSPHFPLATRSSGRLPLYARGAATASAGTGGLPSGYQEPAASSASSLGSFPGFQQHPASPPQQRAGPAMSPPGFSRSRFAQQQQQQQVQL